MASRPVLNLDQLADRPVVIIGNREYRLFTIDLLPPLENYRVRQLLKRNDDLSAKDALTTDEERELAKGLDDVCRLVLDAPDAIQKKLKDWQRVEIIQSFQVPSLTLIERLAAAIKTDPPAPLLEIRTGETSPPASAGSTQP